MEPKSLFMATLIAFFPASALASPNNLVCYLWSINTYDPITITFDDSVHTVSVGASEWTVQLEGKNTKKQYVFSFDGPTSIERFDANQIDFSIPAHSPNFINGAQVLLHWSVDRLTGGLVVTINDMYKNVFFTSTAYGDKACAKAVAKF